MLSTISNLWADYGMTVIGYIVTFISGIVIGYVMEGGDFYDKR